MELGSEILQKGLDINDLNIRLDIRCSLISNLVWRKKYQTVSVNNPDGKKVDDTIFAPNSWLMHYGYIFDLYGGAFFK